MSSVGFEPNRDIECVHTVRKKFLKWAGFFRKKLISQKSDRFSIFFFSNFNCPPGGGIFDHMSDGVGGYWLVDIAISNSPSYEMGNF